MSTESIIAPSDVVIPDNAQTPLVDSYSAFSTYVVWFSFLIVVWFTGGVALYALLQRNGMLYWIAYVFWVLPIVGLAVSVLTGSSVVVWSGVILFWAYVFLTVEAVRTLLLGYDPGTVVRLLMTPDPAKLV